MRLTSENIFDKLFDDIPEFSKYRDESFRGHLHNQFAFFVRFLIDGINDKDKDIIKKSGNFINKMAVSDDINVIDVLSTTIFIGLFDEGLKYIEEVKKHLSDEAIAILEDTINNWQSGNHYQ
jgi:hypothetical protein